CMESLLFPWTF
nr:immunoglobulin light chain junction region [Macaca mulatta]